MTQLPVEGEGTTPDFNPMSCHSEVFHHAPGMPKIAGEGGVGVLLGPILMYLVHYLIIQAGYPEKNRNPFDTHVREHEQTQQL